MGYRPITAVMQLGEKEEEAELTDIWLLARPTGGYYGAYPKGFLERARALLGVSINDAVLHICSGDIHNYPYKKRALGPYDRTLDLDASLFPDYLQDAREKFPLREVEGERYYWDAVLADPPYTEEDATHYAVGKEVMPTPNLLLKNGLIAVRPGGRVGILHYIIPQPPNEKHVGFETKFVALVGVIVGFNNRIRAYSVFEKVAENKGEEEG